MTFLPQADVEGLEVYLQMVVGLDLQEWMMLSLQIQDNSWSAGQTKNLELAPIELYLLKIDIVSQSLLLLIPHLSQFAIPSKHVSDENPAKYPSQSYWEFYNWYMVNTILTMRNSIHQKFLVRINFIVR